MSAFRFLVFCLLAGAAAVSPATRAEAVRLRLHDGSPLEAQVRWPEGASGPRRGPTGLPALMLFGGFEHAAEVLDLVHPRVPVVLASFDYPFRGSREFSFPRTFFEAPELKRSIPDTIEGIRALAGWLAGHPDVDPARVGVIGASFASPFVVTAAAQDGRIRALVVVHGFGDFEGTVRHRLGQVLERRLGGLAQAVAGPAAWAVDAYLAPPAPEEEAARLRPTQLALMIEATEDELIPRRSRELLWRGLQASESPAERIAMAGGHLMPGAGALIDRIMGIATDWLQKKRFLGQDSRDDVQVRR